MDKTLIFIERRLPIDSDAAIHLATVWTNKFADKNLEEYLEILADYDYDTCNRKIDLKTVEAFIEEELE